MNNYWSKMTMWIFSISMFIRKRFLLHHAYKGDEEYVYFAN